MPDAGVVRVALDSFVTLAVVLLLLTAGLEVDLSTALRQGKEEVARAALLRKRTCRLQAEEKREQLNQLRAIAVSLEGSVKALSS